MSRFTKAVVVPTGLKIRGRDEILLISDIVYEVGFLGSGLKIRAPAGFTCDGVSYWPLWLRHILPIDQMFRSAVIHDLARKDLRYPKLLGDYIFFEAMGVEGVPMLPRLLSTIVVLCNFSRW